MPVAVIKHGCKPHPHQDKTLGGNKRYFTTTADSPARHRCTVCSSEQSVGNDTPSKKKSDSKAKA